jgi:acyl-CoA hydrolase
VAPVAISPDRLVDHLPARGLVWWHACSGDSHLLAQGIGQAGPLPGLTFTGIFVPGLNRLAPLLDSGARVTTFFMLPELAKRPDQVTFLPLCYRDIRLFLAANTPQAALLMVSPPDEDGLCSLGPVHDFLADMWDRIPVLIAHVNPLLPRTRGTPGIPYDRLTAVIAAEQPLVESDPGSDAVADAIARHAASVIPDGATLQAGLGRAPEAVLRGLTGHRGLSIHSGLIGDSALDLLNVGALRDGQAITAGVAIGTRRLYDALGHPAFRFAPPSITHDLRRLAALERFVTVNSVIEIDLSGLAHAEATPRGPVSGPGGASDFCAGARGLDGLRILVLPSTAGDGTISRIVAAGTGVGPVSLGRFDTDLVITEHGIADLRGASQADRARRLVAIAAPRHRETLLSSL